ncbi:MAG: MFS transporter [Hyphomicrobiaceae bacterium]|nr:MFS transporter [Hyphomicrobiaceae bacterium]
MLLPSRLRSRLIGSPGTRYGLGVALYFAALFLIYGVHLPYLPVWLDSRGLDAGQIAIVTAAPYVLRLVVTPSVAVLTDRSSTHRLAIVLLSAMSAVLALFLSQAHGFWPILVSAVCLSIAMTTVMPLVEVLAVGGVRAHGLTYGRMRLWGSAAFILASLCGAVALDALGASSIVWLIAAAAAVTALAALALPEAPRWQLQTAAGPAEPATAVNSPPPGGGLLRIADVGRLIATPMFLTFLAASGFIQAAHATFYTFGSLHWQRQGFDGATIGMLWTLGVLAEIALFGWSGPALRRLGATGLLVLAGTAAILRWTAMAFDPPLAAVIVLQLLHAFTFAAAHLGAVMFIGAAVPDRLAGTAQALHATVGAGVAMGGATLISGTLYSAFGGMAYLGMAALAAAGLVAATYLQANWKGGPVLVQRD